MPAWADQWLDSKLNLTPKTRERYEVIIRAHVKPTWGSTPLSKIMHAGLQRWIASINAAPGTVRKVHRVMSMILAYAGLRWGEFAALRLRRVDFLRRRVLVAESVTPSGGGLVWGEPKGHERREVPIPPFLVEALAQHVEGKGPEDLVFTNRQGQVLRAQTFQRAALTGAAEEIGVPRFHPHELRHTAASLAIASGADVKVVQQLLGHKSATMTLDQYGHLFPDRLDVVADAMDAGKAAALSRRHHSGTTPDEAEVISFPK